MNKNIFICIFYLKILMQGHDPVAAAMSFTLYTLSRHPEIQSKAFKEQQRIFANNLSGEADLVSLDQMVYLELIIRETLRLYPSVPLIARTNRKPIDISKFCQESRFHEPNAGYFQMAPRWPSAPR